MSGVFLTDELQVQGNWPLSTQLTQQCNPDAAAFGCTGHLQKRSGLGMMFYGTGRIWMIPQLI